MELRAVKTGATRPLDGPRSGSRTEFFSGRRTEEVLNELRGTNHVIVSEPFTYKYAIKTGDKLTLSLGGKKDKFRVVDVYYDYASERGYILMDRNVMLRYLPDRALTGYDHPVTLGSER